MTTKTTDAATRLAGVRVPCDQCLGTPLHPPSAFLCKGTGLVFLFPASTGVREPCPDPDNWEWTYKGRCSVCGATDSRHTGWTASRDLATWLDAGRILGEIEVGSSSCDMWSAAIWLDGKQTPSPDIYEDKPTALEAVLAGITAAADALPGVRWPE